MTTQTANTRDTFILQARNAGEATAKGVDGIMTLALSVMEGVRTKALTLDGDDITDMYKAYAETANASAYGSRINVADAKAIKPAVSKLRTFGKVAQLPGKTAAKLALIQRTVNLANKADNGKGVHSRYETVLKVFRFAASKGVGRITLTDAEIKNVLAPPKEERDEVLARLEAIAKAAKSAAEKEDPAFLKHSGYFARIAAAAAEQLSDYKAAMGISSQEEAPAEDDDESFDVDLSELLQGNVPAENQGAGLQAAA